MSVGSVRMGSERSFGLVFAAVFALVAGWPLIGGSDVRAWAMALAAAFLLIALVRPALLAPLNRLWFRFGLAIGAIMTPLVMGLLFMVAVVPTGLMMKLFGKDPMQRRMLREAKTYWEPRSHQPGSMREQF